jgi:tetratricopeptide (TPR) repeat protein
VLRAICVVAVVAVVGSIAPPASGDPFWKCYGLHDKNRVQWANCLVETATEHGGFDRVAKLLAEQVVKDHGQPIIELMLGNVLLEQGKLVEAEVVWRHALAEFDASTDGSALTGKLAIRTSLARLLRQRGRIADATAMLEDARTIAVASGQRWRIAEIDVELAGDLAERGLDLDRARTLAANAWDTVSVESEASVQSECLLVLGRIARRAGRYRESLDEFGKLLRSPSTTTYARAAAELEVASTILASIEDGGPGERDEAHTQAAAALADAQASDNRVVAAHAQLLLAELAPSPDTPALEACLQTRVPAIASGCKRLLVEAIATTDPQRALALANEELAAARGSDDGERIVRALQTRSKIAPSPVATRELLDALDDLASIAPRRAKAMYREMIGRRLERGDVAGAFTAAEAMRVERRSNPRAGELAAAAARRAQLLVDPVLDDASRAAGVREVEQMRADARAARGPAPVLASLTDLQSALEPDDAVLWLATGPRASLVVITRAGTQIRALGDGRTLGDAARLFAGLAMRRDRPDLLAHAKAIVGERLFGPDLAMLPAAHRLIVLADDPLSPVLARLLVDRDVVSATSATAWVHDPRPPSRPMTTADERRWPWLAAGALLVTLAIVALVRPLRRRRT